MTQQNSATGILDELMTTLESAANEQQEKQTSSRTSTGDAIDAELSSPKRVSKVISLRDSAEVANFRQALIDGLMRADTANRLLRLVNDLIVQWLGQ